MGIGILSPSPCVLHTSVQNNELLLTSNERCGRNCFDCPVCSAPLAVTVLGEHAQDGPWILSCGYCMWTTLDAGIHLDKPTNIRAQLAAQAEPSPPEGRAASSGTQRERERERDTAAAPLTPVDREAAARFTALRTFYRKQLAETAGGASDPFPLGLGSHFGDPYTSSPSSLGRIMALYSTGLGGLHGAGRRHKAKPPVMREALTAAEGLHVGDTAVEDEAIASLLETDDMDTLASLEQRLDNPPGTGMGLATRFADSLRPRPTRLRTKRAKRCQACKHILVKPEFKPQSTRFRIRLIALSYIPLTSIRPLPLTTSSSTASSLSSLQPLPLPDLNALPPGRPVQFLLTLRNHMFDPVRVTLATPATTPGVVASRVTILCPVFEVGANSDVWDDALAGTGPGTGSGGAGGGAGMAGDDERNRRGGDGVPEAGKVWDRGRNWTTVAMEVVPGTLPTGGDGDDVDVDVLEIPVFVRLEWEAEGGGEELSVRDRGQSETVRRELAYWMVLGVGRIRR